MTDNWEGPHRFEFAQMFAGNRGPPAPNAGRQHFINDPGGIGNLHDLEQLLIPRRPQEDNNLRFMRPPMPVFAQPAAPADVAALEAARRQAIIQQHRQAIAMPAAGEQRGAQMAQLGMARARLLVSSSV